MTKDDIGKTFKKTDFGIARIEWPRANQIVEGQRYVFISIKNRYNLKNELHSDGLLFEVQDDNKAAELVPIGGSRNTIAHIFIRKEAGDNPYFYLGECTEIKGITSGSNKFILPISQGLIQQLT